MKHVKLKHGIATVTGKVKPETLEALDELMAAAEKQASTMPRRIQRKRTKGFNLQAASPNGLPVVYVGRPTMYGNPFKVGEVLANQNLLPWVFETARRNGIDATRPLTGDAVLVLFREHAKRNDGLLLQEIILKSLKGKNLACWCAVWECAGGHRFGHEIPYSRVIKYCRKCSRPLTRVPCHADILLELANSAK